MFNTKLLQITTEITENLPYHIFPNMHTFVGYYQRIEIKNKLRSISGDFLINIGKDFFYDLT